MLFRKSNVLLREGQYGLLSAFLETLVYKFPIMFYRNQLLLGEKQNSEG
jgi:hypothetical protein